MDWRSRFSHVWLALGLWLLAAAVPAAEPSRWVVVHPPGEPFAAALKPLIEQRRAQQLQVALIPADQLSRERLLKACGDGPAYVLLAGTWDSKSPAHVAMQRGRHGRMLARLTDYPLAPRSKTGAPSIAVGRLPARTADELRMMVDKTLRLERAAWGAGARRLSLLVGHPGGNSTLERRVGESMVNSAATKRLAELHPQWQADCLVDMPGTVFSAPGKFRERMLERLTGPYLMSCYAGHSSARGVWCTEGYLTREQLAALESQHPPGIWISCGCFGCQVRGADGTGYCVDAVRSPSGPAAAIGALAESYAAPGQLALDGLAKCLAMDQPPPRLGDYYLAMQQSLAEGEINALTFWLYDQGDGSGGRVPLADQRREHLEMWILLGDPGMRLPLTRPDLKLTLDAQPLPGAEVTVTVSGLRLPAGAQVTVAAESRDAGPQSRPRFGEVIATATGASDGESLQVKLKLPDKLPRKTAIRATAKHGEQTQRGLLAVD